MENKNKGEKGGKTKNPASRVIRHRGDFSWRGVRPARYKLAGKGEHWASASRHLLVAGGKGERTKFHLRYFELAPGGFTSFETHAHEHVVIVANGTGEVRLGKKRYEVGPMDAIYIAPGQPHQLLNPGDAPFGFFCIVDAERDRPVVLTEGKPSRGKSRGGRPSASCELR
ncbi:MAG: cupin domain-containing protein [Nitrospiraceae bacterium]|nr:cupin domain-containing protein [Nitrospiraceae bacterium]